MFPLVIVTKSVTLMPTDKQPDAIDAGGHLSPFVLSEAVFTLVSPHVSLTSAFERAIKQCDKPTQRMVKPSSHFEDVDFSRGQSERQIYRGL